jgi:hypothetical protein
MKNLIVLILALMIAVPALSYAAPDASDAPVVAAKVETKAETKEAPVAPVAEETKKDEAAAPVQEESEGLGYGKMAIQYAMQLGFLLLSILLSGFVTVLLKKFGFQAQTEKVNDVLERARAYAEQWALKKAKAEGEAKPGGPEKMQTAVDFAVKLAAEYKIPTKASDWWEEKLEAWLGVKNGS